MADAADRADAQAEALAPYMMRKGRKPDGPEGTGFCLFCETPIGTMRFCDADCRDDWQRDQDRAARQGRPGEL